MPVIRLQRRVAASPQRCFEVFTDIERLADIVPDITKMEKLTDGPVGVGTRIRCTRMMFGREASETMEFVECEPPKGYQLEARSHGAVYLTTYTFQPDGDDTLVNFDFRAKAESLSAKLVSPLLRLMQGAMQKALLREFDALQTECEKQPAHAR